jgi:hypothetical protein
VQPAGLTVGPTGYGLPDFRRCLAALLQHGALLPIVSVAEFSPRGCYLIVVMGLRLAVSLYQGATWPRCGSAESS